MEKKAYNKPMVEINIIETKWSLMDGLPDSGHADPGVSKAPVF